MGSRQYQSPEERGRQGADLARELLRDQREKLTAWYDAVAAAMAQGDRLQRAMDAADMLSADLGTAEQAMDAFHLLDAFRVGDTNDSLRDRIAGLMVLAGYRAEDIKKVYEMLGWPLPTM